MADKKSEDGNQRAERVSVTNKVEFIIDADIISAESVNISETGICIHTKSPIQICMRVFDDGKSTDYDGKLMRAGKNDDGTMFYGIHFDELPEDWDNS